MGAQSARLRVRPRSRTSWRTVQAPVFEREAGEAVGVVVAVGAGQVAGEDVAGVERHEADVAFVGVAGGQRLDVRGEPEACAGGERDGLAAGR